MRARQMFAPTPQVPGGGVAPMQPTLVKLSRVWGVTTGGAQFYARGYNFTPDVSFTVGGVAATATTFINSSRVLVTTPAGTVGKKDVVATQSGGTSTLATSFEYLPAPTTNYINTNFNGGVIPGAGIQTGTVAVSTDFFIPGSDHSLKWTVNPPGESSLAVNCPNSPMVTLAQGLYLLSYHLIPAATLAQYSTGQIKHHLCRVGNTTPDGEMLITGPQGPSSPRAADGQGVGFTGLRDNGTAQHAGSLTGYALVPGLWVESLLWYLWNGAAGQVRHWVNGQEIYNVTNAGYFSAVTTNTYQPRFGGVFEQLLGAQVVGYLGGMYVNDGVVNGVIL